MIGHLSWSLLGVSESDPMESVDAPSENIARILYAAFLIFAVILLLNMLIALLCNTYQRIEVRGDIGSRPFTVVMICPPNARCCCYMWLFDQSIVSNSLRCVHITQLIRFSFGPLSYV